MKILIVTQYFWPENFRINDIAMGFLERGHQVTVLTGIPNYPDGKCFSGYGLFKNTRQNYNGAKVLRVPLMPRGKGGAVRLVLNYMSFVVFASLLGPFLCRDRYDLIFVFEPSPITVCLPAIVMKKLKRAPIFFFVLDLWPESLAATGAVRSPKLLRMVENLVRFIYRCCDCILVPSRAYYGSIGRFGVENEKIVYFPNSADDLYRPVASDAKDGRLNLPKGFVVMYAGNIGVAQDFPTIISAAEELKGRADIHFVILGDGRMYSWAEEQIEKRGLSATVHLLGRHPIEEMPEYFALADAMLVTLRQDPIFSLTIPARIQAYMACGRPIIAALDGEGARIVEEAGAGLTCETQHPSLLAKTVLEMYNMKEDERSAMGKRGREYYEKHFDRMMLLDRLETSIAKVMAETQVADVQGEKESG